MLFHRSQCVRLLAGWLLIGGLLGTTVLADEYEVYLLAGQSNMDGRGLAEKLTEEQRQPSSNAIIFYRSVSIASDGWQPLRPGFSVPPKYEGELPSHKFGPEIGFAHAMDREKPGRKLALIKGSKGGTSLRVDWKPGVQGQPETQGPRYRDFVETIQLATDQLIERGDTFTIRGLLWHQGESDSKSSTEAYRERLERFVARIREDVGIVDLPIVVGEVFDNGKRDTVIEAIRIVGSSAPALALVSAEGTTTWDEGTHFDAPSQLLLGKRYADAMLSIQASGGVTQPRVVCFGDSITKRGYPAVVGKLLDIAAINSGVGGNTTSKAIRRLSRDVLSRKPDVIVVLFGTNDLRVDNEKVHVPIAQYVDNLKKIVGACREAGAKVVLCTLPPIAEEEFFERHEQIRFEQVGGLQELIGQYQAAAIQVATERETALVDLQSLLLKTPEWLSPDGVHPSVPGNAIIAEHIAEAVLPLLPSKATAEPSSD